MNYLNIFLSNFSSYMNCVFSSDFRPTPQQINNPIIAKLKQNGVKIAAISIATERTVDLMENKQGMRKIKKEEEKGEGLS